MTEEGYGTTHREIMKDVMSKPAGEWKPLNRKRRMADRWWYQISLHLLTIIFCVGSWYVLNWLEHFGRAVHR